MLNMAKLKPSRTSPNTTRINFLLIFYVNYYFLISTTVNSYDFRFDQHNQQHQQQQQQQQIDPPPHLDQYYHYNHHPQQEQHQEQEPEHHQPHPYQQHQQQQQNGYQNQPTFILTENFNSLNYNQNNPNQNQPLPSSSTSFTNAPNPDNLLNYQDFTVPSASTSSSSSSASTSSSSSSSSNFSTSLSSSPTTTTSTPLFFINNFQHTTTNAAEQQQLEQTEQLPSSSTTGILLNPKDYNNDDDGSQQTKTSPSQSSSASSLLLNKCEFWLVTQEGNLTSFGDFTQNVNCLYRITPPLEQNVCSLELHFNDFQVKDERSELKKNKEIDDKQIEKEFTILSTNPDSCIDNYLEFNNRKRYCHDDWIGRMDIVEIDPNYEKDFVFRLVLDQKTRSSGFNIKYKSIFDSCKSSRKSLLLSSSLDNYEKMKDSDSTLYPIQTQLSVSSPNSLSYCEERFNKLEFEIKSENYPKNYSNNLDCVYYIIRESDDICGLELKFLHFDLENSESCVYDFFEIDGETFCGHLPNGSRNIFKFDTTVKSISFQTDSQVNSAGFHIKFRQVNDCTNSFIPIDNNNNNNDGNGKKGISPSSSSTTSSGRKQKCSIVWHELNGQLNSLKYPESYPNDLLCAYTIEKNPNGMFCSIQMDFLNFDLQNSKDCMSDFFEIENKRYCGQSLKQNRLTIPFNTDGYLRFLFKSDSIESKQGFLLNYTQLPCNNNHDNNHGNGKNNLDHHQQQQLLATTQKYLPDDLQGQQQPEMGHFQPELCEKYFQDKKFDLISDLVDGHYKDNQNCKFTIRKYSKKVCYLEMHFKMFDLEASTDCQYDFMEIGTAVRLCGTLNQETSRIYVFDKPEILITFHTDSTNERKGYFIETEQLECEGDRIIREHQQQQQQEQDPSDHQQNFLLQNEDSINNGYNNNREEGLQSLEQYKFEQQQHYIPVINDTSIDHHYHHHHPQQLQQQENFVHQTQSEFHPNSLTSLDDHQKTKKSQSNSMLCSKTYQEKEFFIHSPGFPGNYPTDLDCIYMIIPSNLNICKIEINFDTFQLQPYDFEKNCLKSDFIDFDNREQFCGKMVESQRKYYPFQSNETFFIHFHSDSFRTSFDKGFRLYLRQIECPSPSSSSSSSSKSFSSIKTQSIAQQPNQPSSQQNYCGRIFMSSAFEIFSPLYPDPYPANSFCDYRIVKFKSPGINICFLEVQFVDFELQQSSDCTRDFVNFNGIKACGSVAKNSVRLFPFYDNEFIIRFFSDPLINQRGFHLKIRQNECPDGPGQTSKPSSTPTVPIIPHEPYSQYQIYHANQICQQTFGSTYFEFESPNYPQYYLPSLSCIYTIQRRHSRFCKLELFINDFDIEPSTRCIEDYLLIDNIKYCNSNRPNSVLQLPFYEPEKRIYFRSISFRPRKGFAIQARQIDCDRLLNDPIPSQQPSPPPLPPSSQQQQQQNYLKQSKTNLVKSPASGGRPSANANDDNDRNSKFIFLPSLPSICEICVTEVQGNIQSYDYPNFYPANVNCTYRITPLPDNCMVQIHFKEFDFDFSPECNQDYLEINGIRYCGHQLKDVSMILLNKRKDDLVIRMVTSSRSAMVKPSFKGFRASYTQLPCIDANNNNDGNLSPQQQQQQKQLQQQQIQSTKSLSPGQQQSRPQQGIGGSGTSDIQHLPKESIYCDQTFDDKMFEIKSPGYPYRYFNDMECSYLIRKNSANVCRLKVTFNYFNVIGEDGNCRGDYLDIFNTRFCGVLDRYTSKEIPFLQEKLLLHFHTNQKQTANGFHLTLEQIDCIAVQPLSNNNNNRHPESKSEPDYHHHQNQQNYPRNQQQQQPVNQINSKTNPSRRTKPSSNNNFRPTTTPSSSSSSGHHAKDGPGGGPGSSSSQFKYDDDEIISEFDTRNKAMIPKSKSQIIYEDATQYPIDLTTITMQQQQQGQDPRHRMNQIPKYHGKQGKPSSSSSSDDTIHPVRYYSRNLTVINHDGNEQQKEIPDLMLQGEIRSGTTEPNMNPYQESMNKQQQQQQPQNYQSKQPKPTQNNGEKLCDQTMVDRIFFELKFSDLKQRTKNGVDCQLLIKKAKSNICQLDIMFIRYHLNDTTCQQQYLSIDGERVCGSIHESTVKRFSFNKPELYLFVKLNGHDINDDTFEIKARQMECATNVDLNQLSQHQQPQQPNQQNQQQSRPDDISGQQRSGHEQSVQYHHPSMDYHHQQQQQQPHHGSNQPNQYHYSVKGQFPSNRLRPGQPQQQNQLPPPENQWHTYTMRPFTDDYSNNNPNPNPSPNSPNFHDQNSHSQLEPEQQPQQFDPRCDLIENDRQFQINSPEKKFGNNNHPLVACRYTIRKANDKICAIDIKFDMFRLDDDKKCSKEYMDIDTNRMCGSFPIGHIRRYHFQPDEYEKVIHYIVASNPSLNNNQRGDFKLNIKQIEDCNQPITSKPTLTMPTVCDISVRNYHGQIKSPNYPAPYGDYTKCVYRIQSIGDEYCYVKLLIRDIDIESDHSSNNNNPNNNNRKCEKDWLDLNGKKLCGNQLDQKEFKIPFEQNNNQNNNLNLNNKIAHIKFSSDAFGNGRGFDIEYTQELCSQQQQTNRNTRPNQSGQKGPSIDSRFRTQIRPVQPADYGGPMSYSNLPPSSSSSSSSSAAIRPQYPPNYVSKAHMLKTIDRKELIKMMLMEKERGKMKIINQNKNEEKEEQDEQTGKEGNRNTGRPETTITASMNGKTTQPSSSSSSSSTPPPTTTTTTAKAMISVTTTGSSIGGSSIKNNNVDNVDNPAMITTTTMATVNPIPENTVVFTTMPPSSAENPEHPDDPDNKEITDMMMLMMITTEPPPTTINT